MSAIALCWASRLLERVDLDQTDRPQGPIEELTAEVWQQILNHPNVSRDQSFLDLGGDSLAAMRVTSDLRTRLGVDLSVQTLLDGATVASTATRVFDLLSTDVDVDPSGIVPPGR